jgi:hypothetical protein
MIRGSNSCKGRRLFSFSNRPDVLWVPRILLFNDYRGWFPGVKRPERDVDHSSPPSAEVKNEWSYTSTPIYSFTEWTRTTLLSIYVCLKAPCTGNSRMKCRCKNVDTQRHKAHSSYTHSWYPQIMQPRLGLKALLDRMKTVSRLLSVPPPDKAIQSFSFPATFRKWCTYIRWHNDAV